jgi:hypothetical protein
VLPTGQVRSLELHLVGVALGPGTVPVEDGTALLRTLGAWGSPALGPAGGGPGAEAPESEEVP